ncbi:MAG: Uma2 family endonuclease [Cyclobacteriaceae bacterium]
MHTLVEQILAEPQANLLMQQVQAALAEEQQRRERFYEEMTETQKIEFINGQIFMHSPVKKRHNKAGGLLYKLMDTYVDLHDLGFVGIEKILITLTRNDYEPDICYFSKEQAQYFTEDQMKFPAPNWVVEVLSESTKANDRGIKFKDYEAHGISEYWIIDPEKEVVEQYVLQDSTYELLLKTREGTISSHPLSGFSIPVRAIFDRTENLQALKKITAS